MESKGAVTIILNDIQCCLCFCELIVSTVAGDVGFFRGMIQVIFTLFRKDLPYNGLIKRVHSLLIFGSHSLIARQVVVRMIGHTAQAYIFLSNATIVC